MNKNIVKCRKIIKGVGKGSVIISSDPICFYLVDPKTGVVIEKNHSLEGQKIAGKVLVFPSGKGSSVVQVDGLYDLFIHNNLPSAIIVKNIEPVLVSAAFLVNLPLVDQVSDEFLSFLKNHDRIFLEVNANKEEIKVISPSSPK
jgi:uncharacterized protein